MREIQWPRQQDRLRPVRCRAVSQAFDSKPWPPRLQMLATCSSSSNPGVARERAKAQTPRPSSKAEAHRRIRSPAVEIHDARQRSRPAESRWTTETTTPNATPEIVMVEHL